MSLSRLLFAALFFLSGCGSFRGSGPAAGHLDQAGFQKLIGTLTQGWNTNNARLAADCFTENALYSSPPDPMIRKGRRALFEFFGGDKGRPKPVSVLWHHLVFDEATQIGAGEYTLTYQVRTHGVAMIRIVDGKIANWREYEVESPMNWEQMVGENAF